jgi:DNA-directed RNA polymerase subunit RPC12/RpoP
MKIRVEQPCPQCGGQITLDATHRLLTCPYCGVKNFLQTEGPFRYTLPAAPAADDPQSLLYAPYIRFKGNVFLVSETGISYRVVDTTQEGFPLPGLPPSLGLRPQAMNLARLNSDSPGRFLRLSRKLPVILEKAARINDLSGDRGKKVYHRAYIGEDVSYIYLPLRRENNCLMDAVVDTPLVDCKKASSFPLKGSIYNSRWQVNFLATLCPRCGWSLDGEKDCLVLSCRNCDTTWYLGKKGLERIECRIVPGKPDTSLYLAFWKISAHIPSMKIWSFADFMNRTSQPVLSGKLWKSRVMSFWIPAFKLSPKMFLQTARQATVNQWLLDRDQELHTLPNLYPVTLPFSEARQALKLVLAVSAVSRKDVFPHLPEAQAENITASLVYLPFTDRNYDWMQPRTGAVIAKNVLKLGRHL